MAIKDIKKRFTKKMNTLYWIRIVNQIYSGKINIYFEYANTPKNGKQTLILCFKLRLIGGVYDCSSKRRNFIFPRLTK